jgi:hypothetical protein
MMAWRLRRYGIMGMRDSIQRVFGCLGIVPMIWARNRIEPTNTKKESISHD